MKQKDEISISDIFNELISRRSIIIVIVMSLFFIAVGVSFTNSKEVSYKARFHVLMNHPAVSNSVLDHTPGINEWLKSSENPMVMPNLKRGVLFEVTSKNKNIKEETEKRIVLAVKNYLIKVKKIAKDLDSNKDNGAINGAIFYEKRSTDALAGSLTDLSKIDVEDVTSDISLVFVEVKQLHPNNFKYGILGLSVGLLLSILYVLLSVSLRKGK